MFRYSTIYINIITLIISAIIFIGIELFLSNYQIFTQKSVLKAGFKVENTQTNSKENKENIKNENTEKISKEQFKEETKEVLNNWYLEIPSINLKADIKEGTTKEVMDNYIGHFEETNK